MIEIQKHAVIESFSEFSSVLEDFLFAMLFNAFRAFYFQRIRKYSNRNSPRNSDLKRGSFSFAFKNRWIESDQGISIQRIHLIAIKIISL